MARGMRWWHKWTSIFVGLVFFVWVMTGLVMILPATSVQKASMGQGTGAPVDYAAYGVSPAQALTAARAARGDSVVPAEVSLTRLRDGMAWFIRIPRQKPVLVDAATAAVVEITPALAGEIARDGMPGQPPVKSVELVERHSLRYIGGPLPVYRVTFDDPRAMVAYVGAYDGRVTRADRISRIRTVITDMHTFHQLALVSEDAPDAGLWIAGLVSVATIITGYYLAVPLRRRRGT